jgi:hypothetical protein
MIDPERRDRPATRIAAIRDRVTSKLSRLYDGPLLSSLTRVAASLENYASLLRKTGRDDEAVELEERTKAIRAKHAEENP